MPGQISWTMPRQKLSIYHTLNARASIPTVQGNTILIEEGNANWINLNKYEAKALEQCQVRLRVVRPITKPCITGCHGACNSESIAAMNTQFFFCITVYMHKLIYSIKMIALPFPEEAWQGDKGLTYLLIKVSNEVTYHPETEPFRAILVRGIQ